MGYSTHLSLSDTGRSEDRVVRIVNLHYEAGSEDVREFFGEDFTIVDFIRGVNVKTKKNTVGYVLFATEQERIDAQALSGHRILNREVRILLAQGGFCISASGNRLLPSSENKQIGNSSVGDSSNEAPPAVGDVDAFPPLGMMVNPSLSDCVPVVVPPCKQSAQQRSLQNRSLSLYNVPMQGRKITFEVPKTSQNVNEEDFLPSSHENVVTFSEFPRPSVADSSTLTPSISSLDLREDLLAIPASASVSTAGDNFNESHRLLGRPGMTDGFQNAQNLQATRILNDECQERKTEVTWGMRRDELQQRYLGQQRTLVPMPSGVEGPGQVMTGSPMTPPIVFQSVSARPCDAMRYGTSPGIITTCK